MSICDDCPRHGIDCETCVLEGRLTHPVPPKSKLATMSDAEFERRHDMADLVREVRAMRGELAAARAEQKEVRERLEFHMKDEHNEFKDVVAWIRGGRTIARITTVTFAFFGGLATIAIWLWDHVTFTVK